MEILLKKYNDPPVGILKYSYTTMVYKLKKALYRLK